MSATEDKPFDQLTPDELQALKDRKWTSEEICAAITMALQHHDMPAVVSLLHRLAVVDPLAAEVIMLAFKIGARS